MSFDEEIAEEYAKNLKAKDFIAKPKEIVAYFAFLDGLKKGSQLDKVWRDYNAGEDCYEDSHDGKWVNRDSELEKKYDACVKEKASLRMHNAFIENSLSEAKNIIKDLIDYLGAADCEQKQIRELKLFKEATRFLQEDDRDHFSQLCKIVRR